MKLSLKTGLTPNDNCSVQLQVPLISLTDFLKERIVILAIQMSLIHAIFITYSLGQVKESERMMIQDTNQVT